MSSTAVIASVDAAFTTKEEGSDLALIKDAADLAAAIDGLALQQQLADPVDELLAKLDAALAANPDATFETLNPELHALLPSLLSVGSTHMPSIVSSDKTTGITLSLPIAFTALTPRSLRFNPSVPSVFAVEYDGLEVGTVSLKFPSVLAGGESAKPVAAVAEAILTPPEKGSATDTATRRLISRFTNGSGSVLRIGALRSGGLKGLLNSAIGSAAGLSFELPGNEFKLLKKTVSSFPVSAGLSGITTKAKITIVNPFSVGIAVSFVRARITYDGIYLGTTENEIDFRLPAGTASPVPAEEDAELAAAGALRTVPSEEYLSPKLVLNLSITWAIAQAILRKYRGTLLVDVECEVDVEIGSYATRVEFNQDDVPVSLVWNLW
ncbi:hypothetical protein DFJ73DRAFT_844064 [Zopfochytrium polystomum]|nr:hypothetical protein DFJ73DRAFT_844064 [Zopfochytrium polystomum]